MNPFRRLFSGKSGSFARALAAGDARTIEAMLSKNAQLVGACMGKYDEMPLHMACIAGHLEVVRALLKSGASTEAKDRLEGTALHRAAYNGHKQIVELLVASGAVVDVRGDRFDQTPLFSAAARGHVEIADFLISSGAYVNAENSSGYTPLHFAAVKGDREMVELLLRRGADPYKRANDGVTPLDQGRLGGVHVMMEFAAKRLTSAGYDATIQAETLTATSLLKKARESSVHNDKVGARCLYEEAQSFCAAASDTLGEGNALRGLGFLEALSGNPDCARSSYEEALSLFRQGGHKAQEAHALMALGNLTKSTASDEAAKPFFQEAADIFGSLGLSDLKDFALAEISGHPNQEVISEDAVTAIKVLVGKLAIRIAPAKCPGGRLDYSYTNLDPVTRKPFRHVRRCLLIESVEPGRIVAKKVLLGSGDPPGPGDIVSQILEGEEWFDGAWASVGPGGEVIG